MRIIRCAPVRLTRACARRLAFVLAVFAVAACGGDDGTQPVPAFEGRWEVVDANGLTLPQVVLTTRGGDYLLVDALIEFRTRGRLTDQRLFESHTTGGAVEPNVEEWVVSYIRRGDSLFVMRDPVGPNPAQVDTGVVSGSTLELRIQSISRYSPLPVTLTYTRAP